MRQLEKKKKRFQANLLDAAMDESDCRNRWMIRISGKWLLKAMNRWSDGSTRNQEHILDSSKRQK
jgi:hypothetical protein